MEKENTIKSNNNCATKPSQKQQGVLLNQDVFYHVMDFMSLDELLECKDLSRGIQEQTLKRLEAQHVLKIIDINDFIQLIDLVYKESQLHKESELVTENGVFRIFADVFENDDVECEDENILRDIYFFDTSRISASLDKEAVENIYMRFDAQFTLDIVVYRRVERTVIFPRGYVPIYEIFLEIFRNVQEDILFMHYEGAYRRSSKVNRCFCCLSELPKYLEGLTEEEERASQDLAVYSP